MSPGFKLELYRSYADDIEPEHLLSGQPVRIVHKEADGVIERWQDQSGQDESGQDQSVQDQSMCISREEDAKRSSNAVFQIVNEDQLNGSKLSWNAPVRLRHIVSDNVLTVCVDKDNEMKGSPRQLASPAGPPRVHALAPMVVTDVACS